MTSFAKGLVAGYGIAVPVGAIAVLIVVTAARESFRQGFAAGLGAASADLLYATLAVVAGTTLSHPLHAIKSPLHLAAGCVLAAIAIRGLIGVFRFREVAMSAAPANLAATYARFLALTLVNPLTVVYFASIVLADPGTAAPLPAVAFVLGVALASATWQTLLAASGAVAGRVLLERGRIGTAVLGYGIVLALAVHQFARI